MAAKQSRAEAVWENDLIHGSGRVKGGSGVLPELGVSWSARTEAFGGRTSPEELLAAAHASCFAMGLSNTLAKMQAPPQRLEVTAVATFDKVGDGFSVTTMELTVTGRVAGIDATKFEEAARSASVGCPISRALKGNVEVRVRAKLA